MGETVLEPGTRARSKSQRPRTKSDTDPLGNTVEIEAGLPEEPRSSEGLTSWEVLERTRDRLRQEATEHPEASGDWWTTLPSGHLHVFAYEKGRVLDDFVVRKEPIAIKHGVVKTALMRTLGVRDEGEQPFNARMRTFLKLGLFGPIGIQRERRNYGYSLTSALKWAIAMTLQRAYVPPTAVVDFLDLHDRELYRLYRQLRTGDGPPLRLRVHIEALLPLGDEQRAKGKGARGGEADTLQIGEPPQKPFDIVASAPILDIDLRELGNKLLANLIDAGVDADKVHRARRILPDLSARPTPPPALPSPPEPSAADQARPAACITLQALQSEPRTPAQCSARRRRKAASGSATRSRAATAKGSLSRRRRNQSSRATRRSISALVALTGGTSARTAAPAATTSRRRSSSQAAQSTRPGAACDTGRDDGRTTGRARSGSSAASAADNSLPASRWTSNPSSSKWNSGCAALDDACTMRAGQPSSPNTEHDGGRCGRAGPQNSDKARFRPARCAYPFFSLTHDDARRGAMQAPGVARPLMSPPVGRDGSGLRDEGREDVRQTRVGTRRGDAATATPLTLGVGACD